MPTVDLNHLQALDYVLLGAFMVLMAAIGSFFGWFIKDAASYLKGGNTIPWTIAGVSNFMSMFSTFVFVAYAGIAYEHGLVVLVVFWSTVPPCVVAGRYLATRWRRSNLTTPVEYLEQRFNLGVRQVFSWMGLLMRFLDNAVRLYATAVFLAAVTPFSVPEAIVASGIFITIFTMIGGLWAVTVLDTIQFIVLMLCSAILVPLSLQAAGGISGIAAAAPTQLEWFHGPKGVPLWLFAYYLLVALKYNSNWAFIQRLYVVRDEPSARKVGYLTAFMFLVSPVIFLLPPLAARVFLPGLADPEQAYVAACAHLLPAGMMGLVVASMFAATMSSLNSEFNVMAAVLTKDFYQRFIRPAADDRHLVWMARATTVGVGTVVIFGAMFVGGFGGAFEANKLFASVFAVPLAIPLLGGLLWRRPNSLGALLCAVLGSGFAAALHFNNHLAWEVATPLVVLVCLALFLLPAGRSPALDERVAIFFARLARPLSADEIPVLNPGFSYALGRLFGLSFLIAGGFFVAVGLFTLANLGGRLALAAGLACMAAGGAFLFRHRRPVPST
ncbi:MAG: sodium transporter [Verrucomicrobia bacterium]|nr:sodium transporter [Verrucomicrobiota bacterium]